MGVPDLPRRLIVRGVVLVIVGGYFLLAAYYVDPSQAGGLGDVFL